jgi:formylglycine-generating enzyme required for sulfatase activity
MGDWLELYKLDAPPIHKVSIDTFYLSAYEVTNDEFKSFVDETNYIPTSEQTEGMHTFRVDRFGYIKGANWKNVLPQEGNHPVSAVSWIDAIEYCNWLSKKNNLNPCYTIDSLGKTACNFNANGYRLPTEAEWEYAARNCGKKYRYTWGNQNPDTLMKFENIKDISSNDTLKYYIDWGEYWETYNDGFAFKSPVGYFKANEIGLFDMTGNVAEWYWDWFNKDYYKNKPTNNPKGPEIGELRTCKGGGWNCPPSVLHFANRGRSVPHGLWNNVGFRVARNYN